MTPEYITEVKPQSKGAVTELLLTYIKNRTASDKLLFEDTCAILIRIADQIFNSKITAESSKEVQDSILLL